MLHGFSRLSLKMRGYPAVLRCLATREAGSRQHSFLGSRQCFPALIQCPRNGAVYNIVGGRYANCSMIDTPDPLTGTLALRERVGELYWKRRDPIIDDKNLPRMVTLKRHRA
jgi:hypothetical protein